MTAETDLQSLPQEPPPDAAEAAEAASHGPGAPCVAEQLDKIMADRKGKTEEVPALIQM